LNGCHDSKVFTLAQSVKRLVEGEADRGNG
jgi:hypothetical protein